MGNGVAHHVLYNTDRVLSNAICMLSHLAEKEHVLTRIRRECTSAKARAERHYLARGEDQEQANLHASRRFHPLRVVVEEELLALNLTSSGGTSVERLQELFEGVAYVVHEGYSFPSIRNVAPEPHLLAVATLEAVRRGVNLRFSGGEPAEVVRMLSGKKATKGRPFILFSEALPRFLEVADEKVMFDRDATEGERIFREAIQLHEAQGAIFLTRVDGGGQSCSATSALEERLVIHVSPAWFADLIRRVVDIRLLDPVQQGKVAEAMERYAPFESLQALSKQTLQTAQEVLPGRRSEQRLHQVPVEGPRHGVGPGKPQCRERHLSGCRKMVST